MDRKSMQLFGVTEEEIERLIGKALAYGGDYADLYFENTESELLSLEDGKVNRAGKNIDFGVGIRVVKGEECGYAYSESTSLPEMERAAEFAARIANEKGKKIAPMSFRQIGENNFYPIINDECKRDKIAFLERLCERVAAAGKRAIKINAMISYSCSNILFFNSLGDAFSDVRPMLSVVCGCTLEENGKLEQLSASRSYRCGIEGLDDKIIEEIAKKIAKEGELLFQAKQPKGGQMNVVMGNGSSGILLHEAVGHAFEADFIRKNTSIFSGRLGEKICSEKINIVDDGTIAHNRGAVNYDDEGVPGQKTYLVKDGLLNSFLHDRISAKFYNTAPTGNGRRESFRHMPIPRMRATYMESGESQPEEIIASLKKGIYVDNFTNGQVKIGAGDFTFYVKSGFMIENGRLTAPIKDINIIGNGPKALQEISMVGNDALIDDSTWNCGKGQYCPVSCGMPTVLVKNLIVGGKSDV